MLCFLQQTVKKGKDKTSTAAVTRSAGNGHATGIGRATRSTGIVPTTTSTYLRGNKSKHPSRTAPKPLPVPLAKPHRKRKRSDPLSLPRKKRRTNKSVKCQSKTQSSSATSKCLDLRNQKFFRLCLDEEGEEDLGIDTPKYTLEQVAKHLKVKIPLFPNSDQVATKCVEKVCSQLELLVEIRTARAIPNLSRLANLFSSSRHQPDVVVYTPNMKKLVVVIEVQSSPMSETEAKTILGAIDALRMLRYSDPSQSEISVFCFPKLKVQQCIIKIQVKWNNYRFNTHIWRYRSIKDGISALKLVLREQYHLPDIPKNLDDRSLMPLTLAECKYFGGSTIQLKSSTHLVVTNKVKVFKVLYAAAEFLKIEQAVKIFTQTKPKFSTSLEVVDMLNVEFCYSYNYLPYGHLRRDEARLCLNDFLERMEKTLNELHNMGMSHNDIRLENVCFDSDFNPILIDFDMSSKTEGIQHENVMMSRQGCMYSSFNYPYLLRDGMKTDFSQLGWLAAWVLDESAPAKDYHNREWVNQPECIKQYRFIDSLITKGVFEKELIKDLPHNLTVPSVLKARIPSSI